MIAKQSFFNTVTIGLAFIIGALNTIYFYPTYLGSELQGLIVALLAISNLIQPIISFGVQHSLIKFFSSCKNKIEKDSLLCFSIIFPAAVFLLVILPVSVFFMEEIISIISSTNKTMGKYLFMILAISFSTAYFEVFYSWSRVNMKTIFGNFMKEFYPRALIFILLISYAFKILDFDLFVMILIAGYYFRLFLIIIYSLSIYRPSFSLTLPKNFKKIFRYSLIIFLSGSAASLILDIDKSMISNFLTIENVAYYSVAIFIAAVIEIPGRAMFQIVNPIVAKLINNNKNKQLIELLKKSSNNLLLVSGLFFLLIILNLDDFYNWSNLEEYKIAIEVVYIVSLAKLFSMSLGCLNNIITNSKYYVYVFWFSIISAFLAVLLNYYLIPSNGILGAAFATFFVIVLINIGKLILIQVTYKASPFNFKTLLSVCLIGIVYFLIIYLKPELIINSIIDSSPIITISIRSLIILFFYCLLSYFLGLTKDFQGAIIQLNIKKG
ncbi:MAG: polysaccharide biosynthesis C-terminal domain-containing protein [Bacteroidota bacterium]|nr:polysaccharide biosynthesis C-terminal domain-containing protein [Bacteroidota bacterium]